jgi:hypothetical protein
MQSQSTATVACDLQMRDTNGKDAQSSEFGQRQPEWASRFLASESPILADL